MTTPAYGSSINTSGIIPPPPNGRVDLLHTPSIATQLLMHERIAIRNKATSYADALSSFWENNLLAQVYFSPENIQIIQNGIRAGVYAMSNNKFIVGVPNINTVKIIMRSTYMQYAEHRTDDIRGQVIRLNDIVLKDAVVHEYNEAKGYLQYRNDQSTLVVPLAR